jgi:alpha-mannosidase
MSRLRQFYLATILLLFSIQLMAGNDLAKVLSELAGRSKNWKEGFQKNSGENTFSYHSFRSDMTDGLITRCTDGKTGIEWETQTLPETTDQNMAGFLWMASLDLTSDKNIFEVSFNGIQRFELPSSQEQNWEITTADGGKLSFVTVKTDDNGDAHGYMSLIAPPGWLQKGGAQKIGITGRANNNNCWIIVFQAADAISYLQNSVKFDLLVKMEIEEINGKLACLLQAPLFLDGTEINYTEESGKTKKAILRKGTTAAEARFSLPFSSKNKAFKLSDPNGEIFVVTSLGESFKTTRLLSKAILTNECTKEGSKVILQAQRTYQPKTVSSMMELSRSILGKGQIFLMNSSHQDIAWMDSPEKCVIERDTMLLTPLLKLAEKDKNYRFDIEDALMLREYTQRHPDKKAIIRQMLTDGRLSCGSTFIQPYEEMYSGEALARQFYLGAKWLKDEFNYKATVYWNEDVPGRTLQMAQLMKKAGTKYMMISRQKRGLFNWYSPDGSFVTVFSPGHYGDAFQSLQKSFPEAAQFVATTSMDWQKFYTGKTPSPVIPVLSDWDMSPSKDYSQLIKNWEKISELQDDKGNYLPVKLPRFKVASTPEFFDALADQKPDLPSLKGERPAVWLYIHGPSHQKALKASREADILLPVAEKLSTINAMVDGSFLSYPEDRLNKAWEAKIYPDHGWGGKHGDITDAYFLSKYEYAKAEAEKIADRGLNELASKVQTDAKKGTPLVVFNSMNQQRTDPVNTMLNFEKGTTFALELMDSDGKSVNCQSGQTTFFEDGSIRSAQLCFTAENVPSIGYRTYYLKPVKEKKKETVSTFKNQAENKFYKLTFANGGLSSIFDKELNQELTDPTKFKAGEIFTMQSIGNGAGEFSDIQKPDMKGFDKTGNYITKWEIEEDGPVYTSYKYRQPIRYAVVEQRIKLYHLQKKIDFDTELLNWEGILYREFRMALPLNMTDGQVAYEVPFGVVEVGKDEIEGAAGERYKTECKNIHPRGIQNWISSSNSIFGVTLSSSVVVADWIDPTDQPVKNQILQPILLASRKSCHWEGNDYLQTGNHTFHFSLTSHQPGWQNGELFGRQANEKLMAVNPGHRFENASLPESLSFFKTDKEKVMISTIKKAEDSNTVIMRVVDTAGKDQSVTIEVFNKITQAKITNLIESEEKPLQVKGKSVKIQLGHHAIETIKIN